MTQEYYTEDNPVPIEAKRDLIRLIAFDNYRTLRDNIKKGRERWGDDLFDYFLKGAEQIPEDFPEFPTLYALTGDDPVPLLPENFYKTAGE